MNRRTRSALIAFPLVLATTLLVWNRGRHFEAQTHPALTAPGDLLQGDAYTAPAAQAMEAGDYQRALGYYLAALADANDDFQRSDIADKLHALGLSAHMRDKGKGSIAISAFEEAILLYHELGASTDEAATQLDLAESRKLRGERAEASKALDAAQALSAKIDDPGLRSNVLFSLADFKLGAGETQEASTLYRASLKLREQVKNPEAIADCLTGLGRVADDEKRLDEALTFYTRSEKILAGIGKTATRAAVLGWHGDTLVKQGKLSEAEALYKEGLGVWEARGQGYWTGFFLARLARIALERNDYPTAKSLAERSLVLLRESNGHPNQALALMVMGDVALKAKDFERAISCHREALTLRRQQQSTRGQRAALEALLKDYKVSGKDPGSLLPELASLGKADSP